MPARAWLLLAILAGCDTPGSGAETTSGDVIPSTTKAELIQAPTAEPIQAIVRRELQRSAADGRDLVVYVGAKWCEPCTYFKQALARGELDAAFPKLRVLEFDLDRDRNRLKVAGCHSSMIPLFAVPQPDGRCSGKHRFAGSKKGPGAVANITPRLKALLAK